MRTANSAPRLGDKAAAVETFGEMRWAEAMRHATLTTGAVQGCEHSQAVVGKLWQRIEVKDKTSRRRQYVNARRLGLGGSPYPQVSRQRTGAPSDRLFGPC